LVKSAQTLENILKIFFKIKWKYKKIF
jgi:hypothetical protein